MLRRCGALLALVAAAAPGCGGDESPSERADCQLPLPAFARDAQAGSVEPLAAGPVAVGVAARDDSLTVVGFCLPDSRFPDPAPALDDGGRRLYPIGGELQQTSAGWRNYFIYPSSRARAASVRRGRRLLGRVVFEDEPARACGLRARAPFRVVGCGAIVVVEWSSRLRLPAARLQLLDVEARGGGGRPLDFYDMGYRDGPRGLLVRFGIRRPGGERVGLRVTRAYVRSGGRVRELRLRERASLRLERA